MRLALARQAERSPRNRPGWICIRCPDDWIILDAGPTPSASRASEVATLEPRIEVAIDLRYLFGLLTGLFQWPNAMLGSHYQIRSFPPRDPDARFRIDPDLPGVLQALRNW